MTSRLIQYCTIFIFALLVASSAVAQQPNVMVINSYHAEYPWVQAHNTALSQGLAGKAVLSFYYLDTKRQPLSEGRKRGNELLSTITQNKPDVVVLTDDFALRELGYPIMNMDIPVVFLGINGNPRHHIGGMTLATGVLERPLLKRSIAYIKDILRGNLHKCLVLFDSGTTAKVVLETIFNGSHSSRFSTTDTSIRLNSKFSQWKKHVLNAKENGFDVIILGLYHTLTDEDGNHVPDEEVATWTSTHSPVPIFGFWDFSIAKDKAIGGLVLSGTPQGVAAASLVRKILNGRSPQTIQPITAEHGRFIFSRSGLRRWNITLPEYFNDPKEPIVFIE